MDPQTRNTALAAAGILVGFGLVAYLMPSIMRSIGNWSPLAAGAVAVVFVAAFFLVFWLRARSQNRKGE